MCGVVVDKYAELVNYLSRLSKYVVCSGCLIMVTAGVLCALLMVYRTHKARPLCLGLVVSYLKREFLIKLHRQ